MTKTRQVVGDHMPPGLRPKPKPVPAQPPAAPAKSK